VLCVRPEAQVTRPATDDPGHGSPGKARKRIDALLRDAREVREVDGGWLIRAPMDTHWQLWLRIDKEWAVMEKWKAEE
jgi:hypothetical protein